MSLDVLRAKVSDVISNSACSAEFYFLLSVDGQLIIKRADIEQAASDELAQNFISTISNEILLNDELSLLDISGADDRANAIYRYDLLDVPVQIQHLTDVLAHDRFETFSFEADDLSHLKGILIILGHGQFQLALYKHQYPVSLLKKDSSFSLVRVRNAHRLIKLEDDILRINSKFEFMCIDGQYYIVDIKTLERFFGFHEAIKNVAIQGIENIQAANIIIDAGVLTARLDDISFSRKLVRSSRKSPVLGIIPSDQIIAFVNTHPALSGKFYLSEDGLQLNLNTKVSQDLFLKLLNDDFLQSELTKRYYASLAKDSIELPVAP
ncbi:MAG: DUF4868 domain-containing protein [Burkholderiales bacterium]|nr:DUF4868 domain-containing protein [Burkholderiales bacterium]MBK8666021.1 DUF4868 domain-containing protein [Burkholderiales bacterium]